MGEQRQHTIVLTLAAGLVAAGNAAADTTAKPARCENNGYIKTLDKLAVRTGPGTQFPTDNEVPKGVTFRCKKVVTGADGNRYSDCGWTDVNGWISIADLGEDTPYGYVKSVCVIDV